MKGSNLGMTNFLNKFYNKVQTFWPEFACLWKCQAQIEQKKPFCLKFLQEKLCSQTVNLAKSFCAPRTKEIVENLEKIEHEVFCENSVVFGIIVSSFREIC